MRADISIRGAVVIRNILIGFLLIFASATGVYAIELDEFSENKTIYINNVVVTGNNVLSEKEIIDIAHFEKEIGFYIRDIRKGIRNLKDCGYFSSVTFSISQAEKGYTLEILVKENPPLASLKVIDSKLLDISMFKKYLKENDIYTDMVFSPVKLEKAIELFNIYNQNYGIFLYLVTYKIVTREEILKEGGKFLYEPDELQRNGIHVIVYIRDIPRMVLGEIRMNNVRVSYDDILGYLNMKQGMPIRSDSELYYRYKKMKKLGFFESVYFKLIPQDESVYRITIETKEIELSEISTSITAPQNIGVIMSAEYYNIAVFDTMRRFRVGAGWEMFVGSPVATIEYTNPFLWKGLFFDLMGSKTDAADSIKNQDNMKLSNIYEGKMTLGTSVYGNIYAYLYQREQYVISQIVDQNYKEIDSYRRKKNLSHSTGLMLMYDDLDDNFFITQGYKVMGDYETYWKRSNLAYKGQVSGELYIPVPFFNLIAAMNQRNNFLIVNKKDSTTTLSLDSRMRTNVQEIENFGDQQTKFTSYTSAELRFPLPQGNEYTRDVSFIIFGEAGGAWSSYSDVSLKGTQFGVGVGLRLSPRKHYSSFLFQFPAGLYIGYRSGDSRPRPTLISHRDSTYYINLTAAF